MNGSVVFDPENRVLSSNVAYFGRRLPDGLYWTLETGQLIQPSATLGYWHWSDGSPDTVILAPAGCSGYLLDVNDTIDYEQLGDLPPQVLLALH